MAMLKNTCANAEAQMVERQKQRAEEIEGVSKALAILSSDETHSLFTKTSNPAAFTQMKIVLNHGASMEKRRSEAATVLLRAAKKHKNSKFAFLATQVKLAQFTVVQAAIDKMIADINQQKNNAIKLKDFCVKAKAPSDLGKFPETAPSDLGKCPETAPSDLGKCPALFLSPLPGRPAFWRHSASGLCPPPGACGVAGTVSPLPRKVVSDPRATAAGLGKSAHHALYPEPSRPPPEMFFADCSQLGDLSPLEHGLAGLTQLQKLTMHFGGCGKLGDLSPLGRGLAGLTQLRELEMFFGGCSQRADLSPLERGPRILIRLLGRLLPAFDKKFNMDMLVVRFIK